MWQTGAVEAKSYSEVVRLAEAELGCLLEEHADYRTSFSFELAAVARMIEGNAEEDHPVEPPPSLIGLRGEEARAARERIHSLLVIEGKEFGRKFPRRYGREILSCARGVRRALLRVKSTSRSDERIPAALVALERIIVALEGTEPGEPSPSENLIHAILSAKEQIQGILEDRPGGPVQAALFGLAGEGIRNGRKPLESLIGDDRDPAPEDAGAIAREMIAACRDARSELEGELEQGTPRNRERLPAVLDALEIVIDNLRQAEAAYEGDRVDAAPRQLQVRDVGDADRRAEAECWGAVLGMSLDLLSAFGREVADWQSLTPDDLASALGELAAEHPRLSVRPAIPKLVDGNTRGAWLILRDLVTSLESGELSPLSVS